MQPLVGASVDGPRGGNRRRQAWMSAGQAMCAAGCGWLFFVHSPTGLTVAYFVAMMGSSIGWGARQPWQDCDTVILTENDSNGSKIIIAVNENDSQ